MKPPRIITRGEFIEICYNFVKEERQYNEPIPEITEDGLDEIDYCLNKPKSGIGNTLFFSTIVEQSAALCFCICKRHCFTNGNKRLAIITTILFLLMNGYTLKTDKPIGRLLYIITMGTVEAKPEQDELIKQGLEEFFNVFIEPLVRTN